MKEQNPDAGFWIKHLSLLPHPEGGVYRETFRSEESIKTNSLPSRYKGERSFYTGIYFLLRGSEFSALHRLKSDEFWHFHAGAALDLYIIHPNGKLENRVLGPDPVSGQSLQLLIENNTWFGARPSDPRSYTLVSCTVCPGFDFSDFEMGERTELIREYPQHKLLIHSLTRI